MREAKLDDFDDGDEHIRDVKINDEIVKVSTENDNDIIISENELNILVGDMCIELKNS